MRCSETDLLRSPIHYGDLFLLTLEPPATPTIAPSLSADDAVVPSFASLGIAPDLATALAASGITEPFPVQVLTIPDALAGRDICGKARTGSGKTLAFGLPLLQLVSKSKPCRPQSIVLVPTRELAGQIARALAPIAVARRVRTTAIYGGASLNRQADVLRAGVDIVIATPGRLNDLLDRGALNLNEVRVVVLDEADQMADMGFMPQVERILGRIEHQHQTLLFSATLDGDVDRLVKRHQDNPVRHEVLTEDENVPTMEHRFVGVTTENKVDVAVAITASANRSLLFVRTQRAADRLSRELVIAGIRAGALHGGLSQPQRERALRAFTSGMQPVLVATNIAARGIHVDGVDIVVHYDPPEDAKTYTHRSGRTARAGAEGVVVTLVEPALVSHVAMLRRHAGIREAVVQMTPDDPRLKDLAAWTPPMSEPAGRPQPATAAAGQPRSDSWEPRRRAENFGGRRSWRPAVAPAGTAAPRSGRPAPRPVSRPAARPQPENAGRNRW